MTYTVDPAQLSQIRDALLRPAPRRQSFSVAQLISQAAQTGWMYRADIEELLLALDGRLAEHASIDVNRWVALFGLRWTSVSPRPKARSTAVFSHDALSAAEVADLLILLERCGFHTDPMPLVSLLLPQVSARALQTGAELRVYWFQRTRHKFAPLALAQAGSLNGLRPIEHFRLETGHKVEVWGHDGARVGGLVITPPKFRRRPDPVETTCATCGYTFWRGDIESSHLHRREHKKRMSYLDPQPHPKLLATKAGGVTAHHVTTHSPSWQHREMYVRALAFKRELRYDFVQWGSPSSDSDPQVNGFLLTDAAGAIVGACAFRWRDSLDIPAHWGLQWIWLCPGQRRKGHVTRHWPVWRRRFGDFAIEAPVSDAMRAFVLKQGDAALLE